MTFNTRLKPLSLSSISCKRGVGASLVGATRLISAQSAFASSVGARVKALDHAAEEELPGGNQTGQLDSSMSENKSEKQWRHLTSAWFLLGLLIPSPLTFSFKTAEVIAQEMSFRFTY